MRRFHCLDAALSLPAGDAGLRDTFCAPPDQGGEALAVPVKLKAFVEHQQHGSKNVAKNFLAQTLDQRLGQYALGTAEQVKASPNIEATEAPFFETFPDDRDHSGVQYFPAVLRGLRSAPPAYVLNLLNGEGLHIPDEFRLSGEELAGIDGVVVVNVGDHEVESETL